MIRLKSCRENEVDSQQGVCELPLNKGGGVADYPILPVSSGSKGGNKGWYRRKDKETGQHRGPWYIQYPKEVNPWTGKIKYVRKKVGSSQKLAERAFAREMLKWEKRKVLGLERKRDYKFGQLVDWYLSLPRKSRLLL